MAKDGLDLGNDGANEGYWRVQMRSERTGRWVRMKGPVLFDTVHPNYGPISGVGTFEGGARAGVALIKVSGGKLDGKTIEVPASDFEDIEAIIPEDAPGLEEARQLDAADGIVVNAPTVVNADSELEQRAENREMIPVVVRDLKVGDIVQQGTPDALFGRITGSRHSSDGETSQIDVTWSDGLSYTMGLTSTDMVKSWPSSSFLSKLPTKHNSTEEQIAAVQSYANQGHSPINGYLRAGGKSGEGSPIIERKDGTRVVLNKWGENYSEQRVLEEARQLDRLIENSPGLWGDTTLYRFIESKELSNEMRLLQPGAILSDKGYISTARGYGWKYEGPNPTEVRMVISAPAGTKALDIQWFKRQSLSSNGESEVLLPRDTTFRVDRVDGHLVYVSIVPKTQKKTGLFNEYDKDEKADEAITNAGEDTPLTDLGFDPEEEITIYRGVPAGITEINPGDWVTTLPQLAKDYAGGGGEVLSMKVKAKDLFADASSGEGAYTEEMVYRPAEVVDALKRVSEVSSYADAITGNVEDLMDLPYSEPFTEIDRNLDNKTVKEIVDLFENTNYGILKVSDVYVVKSEGRENNVYINGNIVTSTGEVVGNFMRIITKHEDGSYSIEHGILKIEDKEYRGTGFGKIFSKVSEDLYRKLGISRIELQAADENGAATWAKAGYDWAERPVEVISKIRRFVDTTGLYDEEGDETVPGSRAYKEKNAAGLEALKDIYYRFERYELGSENYPTPLEIVNIPEVGKYVLGGDVEWAGVKYLNKEEPVAKPEVVDAPIEGWERDGAVESRGESTVLDSILTDEGFKVDGSPDKPLSAVDADVVRDDHAKAIDLYTRSSLWRSINSYLRGDLEEQESSKNIEGTIPMLDEAIAENGEVFEAGRVFRGQRIDKSQSGENWAKFMDGLQPGDIYSDDAYLSTSNSSLLAAREFGIGSYGTWETIAEGTVTADAPGGNGSIFWAIDVPVGTTAFAVPDGMGYAQGAEREVILPRGSKFVIKGVRRVEQNKPDADPDATKSYNYFVDAELLPVEVPKTVDAPIVEEQPEKAKMVLPLPPRSLPIPEGHVRLFHYTNENAIESIRKNGLIPQQEGNAAVDDNVGLIWAMENAPVGGEKQFNERPIVEFHVPEEVWEKGAGLGFGRTAMDLPVPPENILAIHEPWQFLVRDLSDMKPADIKYSLDLQKPYYDRLGSDFKKVIDYFEQNPPEESGTVDWVEVDGVQSKGKSEIFDGILTWYEFEYGGLRRPVGMADSTNFTYEQQRALSNYTGSDFKDINDYLRTGKLDEDSVYDEDIMKSEIEEIDAAIVENGYVEEAATVFRGMKIKKSTVTDSGESWATVLENLQVGDVYYEKSYLSTSNSPAVAHHAFASGGLPDYFETTEDVSNNAFEKGTAFWAINIPEGGTALALPVNDDNFEITGDEREEEVILPRGSGLKVIAIRRVRQNRDDGEEAYNYYIEAELVPARKTVESVTEEPEIVDAPIVDGIKPSKSVGQSDTLDSIFVDGTVDLNSLRSPVDPVSAESMSSESYNALTEYASFFYRDINSHLRGYGLEPLQLDKGEEDLERRLKDVEKYISNIDKAIDGAGKLEESARVFRGVKLTGKLLDNYENLEPGDILEDKGYMSTTMNPHTAFMFGSYGFGNIGVLIINVPSGSNVLAVPTALTGSEEEVLLPRGTKLEVKAIRRTERVESGETLYQYYVEADIVPVDQEEVNAPIVEESIDSEVRDLSKFVRVSGPLGSNDGGIYEFGSERIYVKEPQSTLHGENEILASKLYERLGIKAARVSPGVLADGTRVIYSKWLDSTSDLDKRLSDEEYLKKIQEGFGVDAWLANWDVVGLVLDNIVTDTDGDPVRIDAGGSLLFRAQGGEKGYMFGDQVQEIDTLTDGTNPQSARVFGGMTEDQKKQAISKLQEISPEEIEQIVVDTILSDPVDPAALAQKLVNRRADALEQVGLSTEYAPEDDVVGVWINVDGVERIGDAPLFDDYLTDTVVIVNGLQNPIPVLDDSLLTDEQVELLIGYTGDDYDPVNTALREAEKLGTDIESSTIAGIVEGIDEAFEAVGPTKWDTNVFRGMIIDTPEWAQAMENLRPGDEISDAGYASTSNDPEVARRFSMRRDDNPSSENASNHTISGRYGTIFMAINVPEGSKALSIGEISERRSEAEVLLPHGAKFRVEGLRRVKQQRKDGLDYYNYYVEASLVNKPAEVESVDGVTVFDDNPGKVFEWLDDSGLENLTNEEIDSLAKYQASGYVNINRHLRGTQSYGGWLLDSILEHVKNLDSIISKSKGTPTEAILYRAIFNSDDLNFSDLSVGSVISDKAFLSTTSSTEFLEGWLKQQPEGGFIVKLTVPEGTKVVSPYGKNSDDEFKDEYEVIIGRDTNIQVTSIDYENKIVEGLLLSSPEVNPVEETKKSSPGIWGRLKLRELKDRLKAVINDPEVVEILQKYSDSDESVEQLKEVLEEAGIFRKELVTGFWSESISAAEKEYAKKRDPNLDTETNIAPPLPHGGILESGLGTTGYVKTQRAIEAVANNLIIGENTQKAVGEIQKDMIKNGFTSPVVLLYDEESDIFSLKNPEIDSNRLLAAREVGRNSPVVVEINGKSSNPRFFAGKLGIPEDFMPTKEQPEYYEDISGVPNLPVLERSQAEKDAIESYRGWNYLDIKTHMETPYGHPDRTEEERKKLDEIVDNLEKVTSTEPIPEGTILYRGFNLGSEKDQEWYEYFSEVEVGSRLLMPLRFTSTTLDIDVAESYAVMSSKKIAPEDMRSVVLKLVTEEGATGAAFEYDGSVFAREKEVLLPMLANVTVTNVYKDADGVLRIEGVYGPAKYETLDAPTIEEPEEDKARGESAVLDGILATDTVDFTGLREPFTTVKIEDLSEEAHRSILTYTSTSDGYRDINGYLRGEDLEAEEGDDLESKIEDIEEHIGNIDLAIQWQGKLEDSVRVFRGLTLTDDLLEMYKNAVPGQIIREDGYLSTTMRPEYAHGFAKYGDTAFLVINVPAESRALALPTEITHGEEEVILPRRTELKIKAIRRTEKVIESGETRYKYYIEADVVPVSRFEQVSAPVVEEPRVFDSTPRAIYSWMEDGGPETLSNEERNTLAWYQSAGHSRINSYLRGYETYEEFKKISSNSVSFIDSMMAKSKGTPSDAVLYRAIVGNTDLKFEDIAIGSILNDKGYLSTTAKQKFLDLYLKANSSDDGFILKLIVPKGTKAIVPYTKLGDETFEHEYEVILDRNSNIEVTGIDYQNRVIEGIVSMNPEKDNT